MARGWQATTFPKFQGLRAWCYHCNKSTWHKDSRCVLCGYGERHLPVECWCLAEMMMVPVSDIRKGKTMSCGQGACHE